MTAEPTLAIGTIIEKFRLKKFLGAGSFGETYHAINSAGDSVALKILKQNPDSSSQQRFDNEIWALQQCDNQNLPKLISKGEFNNRLFIAMTYARGRTLGEILREQHRQGGAMGEIKAIDVIVETLKALSYLHSIKIIHRDVKPDNIIVKDSAAGVTLIDLGFCKGINPPTGADTFFNAGASRYSPPSKLEHPGRANPKDDVFAAGVIAYQLLTNRFPWTVGNKEDVGDLKNLMQSKTPESIISLNNMVSEPVEKWIFSMLRINDETRFTADEAIDKSKAFRNSPPRSTTSRNTPYQLLARRVIRDPIHGDIRLTEFEWKLMASQEFQRLRHIKQLGLANLVYPSAEHTRFAHSLGTLHVTEKILHSVELSHGRSIAIEDRLTARAYALVHDINHVPFGHTIEDELNLFSRHDENDERTTRMFFSDNSEVGAVLRTTEYGRIILEHLEKDENTVQRKLHLKEFIDSAFGADVLDYIDRDAYFCGLDHRIDSSIFRRFSLISDPQGVEEHLSMRLYGSRGLRLDASYAIQRILLERYSLFLKIYAHPMKYCAGAMLGKGLQHIIGTGKTQLKQKDLEWMTDQELLFRLRDSRPTISSTIAKLLLNRRLFKPVFVGRILQNDELNVQNVDDAQHAFGKVKKLSSPEGRAELERQIARKTNITEMDLVVFYPPTPPGLKKVETWVEDGPGHISKPDYLSNTEYAQLVKRHLSLWKIYVFASPELTEKKVRAIAEEAGLTFGRTNELPNASGFNLNLI